MHRRVPAAEAGIVPAVWSPAIKSFHPTFRPTPAPAHRAGASGVQASHEDAAGETSPGRARDEQDILAYEVLRHIAALSVVGAPAVFASGLLDDLLGTHLVGVRLLAGVVVAVACAVVGGWPAELIGRERRLVQIRLAVFTLAILLLALHATIAIERQPDAASNAEFLLMMFAAIPLAPWPPLALPLAAIAGYGAWQALAAPALVLWLLPAAIAAILVVGLRFRGRVLLSVRLDSQRARLETLLGDYEHGGSELRWEAGSDGILRMAQHGADGTARPAPPPAMNWAGFVRAGCRLDGPTRTDFLTLREALRREQPFRDCVLPIPVAGEECWWAFNGRPVLDAAGEVRGYRGVATDVTERRAAERRVRFLAAHDELTGLANRSSFLAALAAGVSTGARLELVLVNIDGFRLVNETHGGEIGDALLGAVAERLRGLVGAGTLARLDGDEFGILLPGDTADPLAARLPGALGEPFHVAGLELHIGASSGMASAPADGRDAAALFKAASLALVKAKALGGSTAVRYDAALEAAQSDRKALQLDLRSAMARHEFELEYQPIVELTTARIVACEALLRWNHPQRGRVSPAVFIEIAEQIGLIAALGTWVIRTALRDATRWPSDVAVSVNVSPLQFRSAALVEVVTGALATTGFRPSRLMLEVTESTVLGADADTVAALTSLRQAGVRLALDDFGTGYASLAYLDRFQFDALKVDRSFLHNSHRPATGAILEAVAKLGCDLGMRTVAEGVETEAQRARLIELGYNCAQGFLFARPMPAAAIEGVLACGTTPVNSASGALGATSAAV